MTDILGRELKDGDIVVTKGFGGSSSPAKPMSVGVFYGKSVRIPGGSHRTARDMFLVENPGELEKKIKEAVEAEIVAEKKAAEIRKQERKAKQANLVGCVYEMKQDLAIFVYCGEKEVFLYRNGELAWHKKGHLYLSCGYAHRQDPAYVTWDKVATKTKELLNLYSNPSIDVLKNFKSYEKEFHTIDVPREFEFEGTHCWKQGQVTSRGQYDWIEYEDKMKLVVKDV